MRAMPTCTTVLCAAGLALAALAGCGGDDDGIVTGDGAQFEAAARGVVSRDCDKQRECWSDADFADYYGDETCEAYREARIAMQVQSFANAPDPAACESAWLDYLDCWYGVLDQSPCDALYCDADSEGCNEDDCDDLRNASDVTCGTSGV